MGLRVHDERFFTRALRDGVLGLGESYMDGWWDCERIDELFAHIVTLDPSRVPIPLGVKWQYLTDRVFNRQRKSKAFRIADRHYNLGNDLCTAMLDRRMTYSCAYWQDAGTLDDAQEAKLALICRKLGLAPGQTVLDIGCGWDSLLKYAAEKYDVRGVGITVATEQVKLSRELCAGLPIELRVQDYREVTGAFDRVVSVGNYLQSCAGSFRARRNNVWQIVLAKGGVQRGYQSVR